MDGKFETFNAHWIVELIFVIISTPFITVGNLLVIVSVAKFKRLQVPTNYFLILLAVADVSVAVLLPLLMVADTYRPVMNNEYICLLPECLLMTVRGVSILGMMAVALDRHIAIVSPMEYIYIVSVPRIVIFGILAWIFSALVNLSPLMGWMHKLGTQGTSCSYSLVDYKSVILLFCVLFVPAYVIIFYCYTRIFCIARKHVHAIHAVEVSLYGTLKLRYLAKDAKYAKTLAFVVFMLLLLWLPFQLCLFIEKFTSLHVPYWLHNYLSLLTYINSGINPWVYAYKTKEFRAAFRKIRKTLKNNCMRYFDKNHVSSELSQGSIHLSRTNSRADQENYIIQNIYGGSKEESVPNVRAESDDDTNLNQEDPRLTLGTISGQCAFMVANAASLVNFIEEVPQGRSSVPPRTPSNLNRQLTDVFVS